MLPNYDSRPIQEIKLPVSKDILKVKPYTVAQEQIVLESMVDLSNKSEFLINIKRILEANITSEYNIDDMFLIDLIYLNLKLRSISKSEMIEYQIQCDNNECEQFNKPQKCVDEVEDIIFVKNSEKCKKIVKIDDKLTIELQPVKLDFVDYLASKTDSKIDIDNDSDERIDKILIKETLELALVNIAYSIKKVIFEGKVFNEFTIEELLEKILSQLTEAQIQDLQKEKNDMANLYLKIRKKCESCGKIFERVEDDFFVFLT